MAMGAMAALTIGTMAVGAYASAEQASAANKFARSRQAAQVGAARIQSKQIEAQSALEQQKTAREAHQIRSTLRVAAGESIGLGGTYEALLRQADFDEALNVEIIERNKLMAQQAAFSRVQPSPPEQNATLAAILGGLGGVQTGLSLGASGLQIHDLLTPPPATGGT